MSSGPKFRAALRKRGARRKESTRTNPSFVVRRVGAGIMRPWLMSQHTIRERG